MFKIKEVENLTAGLEEDKIKNSFESICKVWVLNFGVCTGCNHDKDTYRTEGQYCQSGGETQ